MKLISLEENGNEDFQPTLEPTPQASLLLCSLLLDQFWYQIMSNQLAKQSGPVVDGKTHHHLSVELRASLRYDIVGYCIVFRVDSAMIDIQ